MEVIESGILGGQKDWQRIVEMIPFDGALPQGNWVKYWDKLAGQVDGKRGGGIRKSRRS